jgi:hypothetical protein
MSAIVCTVGDNGILFFSDGVAYNNEGIILHFASKILPLAAGSAVLGNVGAGGFGSALCSELSNVSDFDDLMECIVDRSKDVFDQYDRYIWEPHVSVIVAGWSENNQTYQAFTFSSRNKKMFAGDELREKEPWSLIPISRGFWMSTSPSSDDLKKAGVPDNFDLPPEELGARLVCACRAHSGHDDDRQDDLDKDDLASIDGAGAKAYAVGGFLQKTWFTKDVFYQEIIHRWPDKIGERVDLSASPLLPAFLTEGGKPTLRE